MKKFEYKYVDASDFNWEETIEEVNRLGEEGWELIIITSVPLK